jgi:DNA polymerase III subunit gamma/tau
MLSTAAFNALLKTLEEPPPHIIFVLATTEAHKVLPTVISRCQRFDFRRISLRVIVERLQQVAAGEELELEPAAADLLARAAQGGLRDALSLLDQAIAFCGPQIDLERTRAMLGLADPGALRRLILYVAEQQAAEGLGLIDELVTAGADLRQLNAQLAEELRALVLARAGADVAQMMDRTDEEARELVALAARFTLEELAACARIFARNETPARGLPVPQLALELSFLDCLSIKRSGGALPVQPAAAVTSPAPRSASAPMSALARPTAPSPPARVAQPAVEELDLAAIERDDPPMPAQGEASAQPPVATPAAPVPPVIQPSRQTPAAEQPAAEQPAAASTASAASAADGELLARASSQWTVIRRVCKQKSAKIFGLLSNARPIVMQDGTPPVMVIEADHEFHYNSLREPANREVVEWAVLQVMEATVRVRIVLAKNSSGAVGGDASGRGPTASGPGDGGPHPTIPNGPTTPNGSNGAGGLGGASPIERGQVRQSSPAPGRPTAEANGSVPAASALRGPANGYISAHTAPARADMDPTPAVATVDLQALEAAARADAVVQELTRSQAIVLADVRPLDDDELE